MKIGDKVCNFISLYRSSSQTLNNFETFSKNFKLNLENIDQRNPFWSWKLEILMLNQGNSTDRIYQFGLHQVIEEPTHILDTSSLCIDLIFTWLPNLIVDSGAHSTLHPNCHHPIVDAKFNFEITYPPPFLREV